MNCGTMESKVKSWLRLFMASGMLLLSAVSYGNEETQVTDAFRGLMQDRSYDDDSEKLFVEKCGMCHRQMGMGTVILARRMDPSRAMLERRDDLNSDFITMAVRQGIGNMPRINRAEVSDAQLLSIIGWLIEAK